MKQSKNFSPFIMTKAIIFDLNGVFIQSRKLSDRYKKEFGVSDEEFMPALNEVLDKARLPNAGDSFLLWKPYLEKWNINFSREEFFDFWFSAEKENPEMITLAKKIKEQGIKIFILSNNFKERTEYYNAHFPFIKEISDGVYYSWQTGFLKSNIRAYQNLLSKNGLKGEDCVYFDDKEENIKLASGLGMKSFVFKDAKDTENILNLLQ